MKTNKELSQAVLQKIQAELPKRERAKKRARVLLALCCALLLLFPSAVLVRQNLNAKQSPEPASDYSQLSEETPPNIEN